MSINGAYCMELCQFSKIMLFYIKLRCHVTNSNLSPLRLTCSTAEEMHTILYFILFCTFPCADLHFIPEKSLKLSQVLFSTDKLFFA